MVICSSALPGLEAAVRIFRPSACDFACAVAVFWTSAWTCRTRPTLLLPIKRFNRSSGELGAILSEERRQLLKERFEQDELKAARQKEEEQEKKEAPPAAAEGGEGHEIATRCRAGAGGAAEAAFSPLSHHLGVHANVTAKTGGSSNDPASQLGAGGVYRGCVCL